MAIIIEPNYELFLQVLIILVVIKGLVQLISGLLKSKIKRPERAGTVEILAGLLNLGVVLYILL